MQHLKCSTMSDTRLLCKQPRRPRKSLGMPRLGEGHQQTQDREPLDAIQMTEYLCPVPRTSIAHHLLLLLNLEEQQLHCNRTAAGEVIGGIISNCNHI